MRPLLYALIVSIPAVAPNAQTLVGFAELPADTFRDGPTSGQFIADDARTHGRTPPFENKQPVQGISSIVASGTPGTYLALSDNGFGAKGNSADYLLCVYRVTPRFKTTDGGEGDVRWEPAFHLSDPDKHIPWPIVADATTYPNSDIPVPAELRQKRLLTGADFDVESMVRLPDGTFWIGDEFGPFLLHVSKDGKLLQPPLSLPGEGMHSPDHPTKDPKKAKIARSAGFEGMALRRSHTNNGTVVLALFPMLEKPLDDGSHPVFAFSPNHQMQGRLEHLPATRHFPLADGASAIGEYLELPERGSPAVAVVIERDSKQHHEAKTKRLSLFRLGNAKVLDKHVVQQAGQDQDLSRPVKSPLLDLLDLDDPHDLDGDGNHTFRFPYLTVESVLAVDDRTLLVVNDNNYPFTSGRGGGEPDATQFILIRLNKPLPTR